MDSTGAAKKGGAPGEPMWVKLPRIGEVTAELDGDGAVVVLGVDPGFGDAPYAVHLGLRVGAGGPIRYGTLDSFTTGDYFYAEVNESGTFDIHLRVQSLPDPRVVKTRGHGGVSVGIYWCATPHGKSCFIGSSFGPTPTPRRIGLSAVGYDEKDFPGRNVTEITDLDSQSIQRLTEANMKSLAALASADTARVAEILYISEVRAMGLIYEARLLLQGKTKQ